jgi:anti-sigma factor RsiW
MNCQETLFIHAYADRELDLVKSLEIEQHLQDCRRCALEYQNQKTLKAALGSAELYYSAPAGLRRRIAAIPQRSDPERRSSRWGWNWLFTAISAAAACALFVFFAINNRPSASDSLLAELTASHVRSLMADHLTDVASSDQHTVKPWFDGKLDFAPPVTDLAASGFPLSGGRLDYARGQPVAALVYLRQKHVINLFIWPASGASDKSFVPANLKGYNLLHWTASGMTFWAVSDLNGAELKEFAEKFGPN